jgi:hypothetical protein
LSGDNNFHHESTALRDGNRLDAESAPWDALGSRPYPDGPIDLARGSAPRYAVLRLHLANLGGELV